MDLTIGMIEDKFRKYPKGTTVNVSCGCCHHGALGNETILDIQDNTNQTYGYIELVVNASSEPQVELSPDKEEFYKKEIERLNKIIKKQEFELKEYKSSIESIQRSCEWALKDKGKWVK